MAHHFLTAANALNPGAELWCLPDPKHSPWCTRLDWYMNFQIAKMLRYQPPKLLAPMEAILEATGLESPSIRATNNASVLIASKSLLPNEWTLCLPYSGELTDWVQSFTKQVGELNVFRCRIFFPEGVKLDEAERSLRDLKLEFDLTYLVEN